MDTALAWANEFGPPPNLPKSLTDIDHRAKLVDAVDLPLASDPVFPSSPRQLSDISSQEKKQRLDNIAKISKQYVPDVNDDSVRLNIVLRLWTGCLTTAKTIALETRSGANTPAIRRVGSEQIDSIARVDSIYLAGVKTAVAFKTIRGQLYSFEGVPEESFVRKIENKKS